MWGIFSDGASGDEEVFGPGCCDGGDVVCYLVAGEVCEAAHGVGCCGSETVGFWDGVREGDNNETMKKTGECCF